MSEESDVAGGDGKVLEACSTLSGLDLKLYFSLSLPADVSPPQWEDWTSVSNTSWSVAEEVWTPERECFWRAGLSQDQILWLSISRYHLKSWTPSLSYIIVIIVSWFYGGLHHKNIKNKNIKNDNWGILSHNPSLN